MSKSSISKRSGTLAIDEVAERLGVNGRTVRKWIDQKGLPCQHYGRARSVDWHEALRWYVQYRAEDVGPCGPQPWSKPPASPVTALETMDQALARKTRAEADLKELQLARESGQVAAISDVEKVLSASNKAIQTLMLALPASLASQLVSLDDRGRIYQILERAVRSTLTNLASIDAILEAQREGQAE